MITPLTTVSFHSLLSLMLAGFPPTAATPQAEATEAVATLLLDLDGNGTLDLLSQDANGQLSVQVHVTGRQYVPVRQDLTRAQITAALSTDLDGDGVLDLYLATPGRDVALVGSGGGRFVDATERLGLQNVGVGHSVERIDVDGDGALELIVHNVGSDVLFWANPSGRFVREERTADGVQSAAPWIVALGATATAAPEAGGVVSDRRGSLRTQQAVVGVASSSASTAGAAQSFFDRLDSVYVNDDANEVDSADIADGTLTGADVSTASGNVSHVGATSLSNPSSMEPALLVTGSGFFGGDSEGLSSAAGTGVRIFHDTLTDTGNIFDYDYDNGESNPLILQQPGGNVGIGTANPSATLHVGGTFRSGGATIDGILTINGGADIVERFDVREDVVEPGTVLTIDPTRPGDLAVSRTAYDSKVAGIASGAGGVDAGICLGQEGVLDGATPVAMTGRVYVRASAENGAIQPGDRLTTATLAGHAMRATDSERSVGAVIGKAMTSLERGTGLVLVLVNLQ